MTMRRTLILLTSLLFLAATATWAAQTTTKQRTPQQFKAKPALDAPAPTGGTPQPSAEQLAAQAWLKSIGYDLTIEQMQALKRLVLQKYSLETVKLITDENMIHVRQLPNLEILQVHRLIGDAGVAHFAGLKKLLVFNMPDSKLTDNGLAVIGGMTQLENLVIPSHPNITDAGVAKLSNLKNLRVLNLTRTKITDASMPFIAQNQSLEKLFISFTGITDAAVPYLKQLRGLQRLDIQGKGISQKGFAELKAALPNTHIVYP
jgi:Leucine-rich repeat (LRR) protein